MKKVSFGELKRILMEYMSTYHMGPRDDTLYKIVDGKKREVDCSTEPEKTIYQYFITYYRCQNRGLNDDVLIEIPEQPQSKTTWNNQDFVQWLILKYDSIETKEMYYKRKSAEREDIKKVINPLLIQRPISPTQIVRLLKVAENLKLPIDESQDWLKPFEEYLEKNKILETLQVLQKQGKIFTTGDNNIETEKDPQRQTVKTELEEDKEAAERYIRTLKIQGQEDKINDVYDWLKRVIIRADLSFNKENFDEDANLRGKIQLLKILLRRYGKFLKMSEQDRMIQFSIDDDNEIETEVPEEPGEPE